MTAFRIGGKRIEVSPTWTDRVVGWFNPRAGVARFRARAQMALLGGYDGGRKRRRGTARWRPAEASADADIIPDLPDLRARARDMARNVPIATGAIATSVNSVVGDGLVPHPALDTDLLGITAEEADQWQRAVKREWALFSKTADFTRVQTFQELQVLAYRGVLESGDICAVRRFRKDQGDVYGTKLQLVEADRLSNPHRRQDTEEMVAGIEFDTHGVPQRYHFADRNPVALYKPASNWTTVPARDADGRQLVLHLYDRLRPDQSRGVPYLAPVIERLKQLCDYADAELRAAVISSMFTVFIESDAAGGDTPILGESDSSLEDNEVKLGPGAVHELVPGEKASFANPARPNDKFDPFVLAVLREVGVALELPYELLIRHFTASYSASRAAIEMAWQFFRRRRQWLARRFCQQVYEWMIEEAVAEGRLSAPGFFADPLVRMAYCQCDWIGPARMSIDPKKDSDADSQDIDMGVKTREQVCIERTGGDWEQKHVQLAKESEARHEARLGASATPAASADPPPPATGDDEDPEDAEERTTG